MMLRSHQVTANVEKLADESVHGQESLRLLRRYEPSHVSLALPCGLVGSTQVQEYLSKPERGRVSTSSPRRFIHSLEHARRRSQTAFWTMALPIPTTTSAPPQSGQSGGSGMLCSEQSRSNLPHSAQSKNTPAL